MPEEMYYRLNGSWIMRKRLRLDNRTSNLGKRETRKMRKLRKLSQRRENHSAHDACAR